mgnify:FL=1
MNKKSRQAATGLRLSGALLSVFASGQALASGFQLIEQGVSGMGSAYAGGSAQAEDASTVFFNPAGMTRLSGTQFIAAAHLVLPQTKFDDDNSTTVTGASLGGDNGQDAGEPGVVPNLYLTHQYNEDVFFGLGINSPFGLKTKYDDGWVGRYYAIKSDLKSININPSVAYRVNRRLSIGAGVNAQYIDAKLTNAVDFGLIMNPALSTSQDGESTVQGDDWAWGYNLGLLFNLTDNTRIGAHYRSKLDYTVKGEVKFNDVPAPLQGNFKNGNARSDVDLPWTLSISMLHQFNPEWAVMADYSRTGWSDLDELRFVFDNGLPDNVTTLNWSDTNRYSLGATYTPPGRWIYRVGTAFDETPIPNAEYRTPRIPGEDRIWASLGVGYRFSDRITFDFGYAHLWVEDPKIDKVAVGEDATRGNLKGEYDASVDIVSAQLNWVF